MGLPRRGWAQDEAGARVQPVGLPGLVGVVARAQTPRATVDWVPQQDVVDGMVASALVALTGRESPVDALASLFPPIGPEERIVIKPNTMGNPAVAGTRAETLVALVRLLRELPTTDGRKVRAEQITVWDNIPPAAYEAELEGLCEAGGSFIGNDWDMDAGNPLALEEPPDDAPILIPRLFSEAAHLISVGALKQHPLGATTGALKNYYGLLTRPWDLHTHGPLALLPFKGKQTLETDLALSLVTAAGTKGSATLPAGTYEAEEAAQAVRPQLEGFFVGSANLYGPYLVIGPGEGDGGGEMSLSGPLAEYLKVSGRRYFPCDVHRAVPGLFSVPQLGGKTRLSMVDGLVGLYEGGPYHEADEFLSYPERTPNTLLLGTDPVAVDAAMTDIVLREQALHEDFDDKGLSPDYLAEAQALGLGVGDLARIRVVDAALQG
jgi:hypothetical protein